MITWEVISHYVRKANNVEVNAMYHSSSFLKLHSKWNGHVQNLFQAEFPKRYHIRVYAKNIQDRNTQFADLINSKAANSS